MVASLGAVPVLYAVAAGPRAEIRSASPGVTLAPVTRTFWLPLASGSASASSLHQGDGGVGDLLGALLVRSRCPPGS